MNGQAVMYASIFILFVLLINSKYPQAAGMLLAVVMLGLIVNRWPQLNALITGR